MAYTLQPTFNINPGCNPQPFETELNSTTYPNLYVALINAVINGNVFAVNGNTAYLVADAQTFGYDTVFKWDLSPLLTSFFAIEQLAAGDLPLCFQADLNDESQDDLVDSYCFASADCGYFDLVTVGGVPVRQASAAGSDKSSTKRYLNAALPFDGPTSLSDFDPTVATLARFLTNCPQPAAIRAEDAAFLAYIFKDTGAPSSGAFNAVRFRGRDAGGLVWTRYMQTTCTDGGVFQIAVGPRQLQEMEDTGKFDGTSAGTFTLDLQTLIVDAGRYNGGTSFTAYTEAFDFEFVETCGMRLHFKNTYGVVDSFTFPNAEKKSNSPISRLFERIFDNTVPQTAQQIGRGKYGATDSDFYTLGADIVTDEQRQWLRELQISPLVCTEVIRTPETGLPEFLPVVVEDGGGLIYDRGLGAQSFEITLRVARDKFVSVI